MSVNVNNSLDWVSTLDNSDFQTKTQQDLALIRLRIQLTGDTAALDKYDAAVSDSLNAEIAIRKELNTILDTAKVKTQALAAEIQKPGTTTIFSDSAAEVEAYVNALEGMQSGETILAGLNAQLADITVQQRELNAQLEAGYITQEQYNEGMVALGAEHLRLTQNIKQVTDAFAENIIVQKASEVEYQKNSVKVEEQIGILEGLKRTLKQLKAENLTIMDPAQLAKSNKQIQELEAEIQRFSNMGKVGFDSAGNAIEQTAVKAGKFEAAIARVTSISNIGARVVTQLTRQIIGLGVGMLSFVIGAKAIEALASYIANLDMFSGRLDQAKHNLEAFNEVQANADKDAGKQIATLETLYKAATDVTLSLKERTKAAQELKKEYPDAFSNSSILAILNGKEADSYKKLTEEIIKNAEARAAATKIQDLTAQKLDIEFQKQKIRNAQLNELGRVGNANDINALPSSPFNTQTDGIGAPVSVKLAKERDAINQRAKNATLIQDQNEKIIDGQISFLSKYASVSSTIQNLTSKPFQIKDPLKDFNKIIKNASSKDDLQNLKDALQAKLNALAPDDSQIATYQEKIRKVEELLKIYSPKTTDGKRAAEQDAESLKKRLALIQEVKNAIEAIDKSQLSADQQALTAISDKFDVLRQKIAAFNSDPKNKNHIISQVDQDKLLSGENAAIDNQANLNENAYIKADIEEKKKLYADYEAFKIKAGSDAANREYEDLLKSGADFQTYLSNLNKSIDTADQTGPIQERRAMIDKVIKENIEAQKKAFDQLLLQTVTYQQQRAEIIKTGEENEKKLRDKGFQDQAEQEEINTQNQLTQLDIQNFKTKDAYKKLFDGLSTLSKSQAENQLGKLYADAAVGLVTGKLTVEAYLTLIKQLDALELALKNNALPQHLIDVGNALSQIGQVVGQVNGSLGGLITTLGTLATSIGNIEKLANNIKAAGGIGKDFTDFASLAATGISAVVSIVNSISTATANRKAAEKAYYDAVLASQQEYNLSLIQELQLKQQINDNVFLKDYKHDILDASMALSKANSDFAKSLEDLQKGQAKVGQKNVVDGKAVLNGVGNGAVAGAVVGSLVPVIGTALGAVAGGIIGGIAGLFGGKKKEDVYAPLLAQYPDLIKKAADGTTVFNEALAKNLVQNNLVNDSTKALLNNTIALNDARQSAIDQINTDIKDLAGSLGNDLQNALVTAFENGTDAAKAFGDSVSKVVQNIVAQFLFQDIFGKEFDKLQTNLKNTLGATGDQNVTKDFVQFFKDAGPLTTQYQAALKAAQDAGNASGLSLFAPTNGTASQSTLSGSIQASITENTAQILSGTLKGVQLNTLQTNTILQGHTLSLGQLVSIAQEQLNNAIQIQINTKRTADNSDNLPVMLDNIKTLVKNTGSSADLALRAAGKFGY